MVPSAKFQDVILFLVLVILHFFMLFWININTLQSALLTFTMAASSHPLYMLIVCGVLTLIYNSKFGFLDSLGFLGTFLFIKISPKTLPKYLTFLFILPIFTNSFVISATFLLLVTFYNFSKIKKSTKLYLLVVIAACATAYELTYEAFPVTMIAVAAFIAIESLIRIMDDAINLGVLIAILSFGLCFIVGIATPAFKFVPHLDYRFLRSGEKVAKNVPYAPISGFVDSRFISKPEAMLLWQQLNPEVKFYYTFNNWENELKSIGFIPIKDRSEIPANHIVAELHGSSLPFSSLRFMYRDLLLSNGPNKNISIDESNGDTALKFIPPNATSSIKTTDFSDVSMSYYEDGMLGISVFSPGIYKKYDGDVYQLLKSQIIRGNERWNHLAIRNIMLPHLRGMLENNPHIPTKRVRDYDREAYVIWISGSNYKRVDKIIKRSITALNTLRRNSLARHFILYTTFPIPSSIYDLEGIEHIQTNCTVPDSGIHPKQPFARYWLQRACIFQINKDLDYNLDKIIALDYDVSFAHSGDHLFDYDGPFAMPLANPISYGQGGLWVLEPSIKHFDGITKIMADPFAGTNCYREVNQFFPFHDETVLGCYFRDKGMFYFGMETDFMTDWTYKTRRPLDNIALFAVHDAGHKPSNWLLYESKLSDYVSLWVEEKRMQWSGL